MSKAMGPLIDSRAPSWHSGARTDGPAEPPSHRHWPYVTVQWEWCL